MDKDQFKKLVQIFTDNMQQKYGDYTYAAGYLESAIAAMYADCSEDVQKHFANQFLNAIAGK